MNVLTGISLHGVVCAAWPVEQITAKITLNCLPNHWRELGLPRDAKFQNATVFQGGHAWPVTFGRVIRLCLSLKVTPVFAPPLSCGFQADIEAFNRRWQESVWSRFKHRNRAAMVAQSDRFVVAHRRRHAVRIEDAPTRCPFPKNWTLNLQQPLQGTVIFLRETDAHGQVKVLGQTWEASPLSSYRLVRADIDLTKKQIQLYSLRRRTPDEHLLLNTHDYEPPTKRFRD